jgi:phage I-like protein
MKQPSPEAIKAAIITFNRSGMAVKPLLNERAKIIDEQFAPLRAELDKLRSDNNLMRDTLSKIATDCGGAAPPASSVEFLCEVRKENLFSIQDNTKLREALKRVLKYLRMPEEESAEFIERLIEKALNQTST